MRSSFTTRVAALLLGTLVGVSTPAVALAHGYAHHEANEHADEHADHDQASSDASNADRDPLSASIGSADDSRDHPHAQLSHALSARLDALQFVLAPEAAKLASRIAFVDTASLRLTTAPPRAGPPDAPPRQPRAPPLG